MIFNDTVGLETYPLYPYLLYQDLQKRLHTVSAQEVRSFLTEWHDTPLAQRLRSTWLELLAKRGNWEAYLRDYTVNDSVVRRCRYLTALIQTGRSEESFQQVEALWLHPDSQPQQCDPLFEAWRRAGHLNQELVWARLRLAIDAGEIRLARYLKRFVDPAEHADVDRWIATREQPSRIARTHDYPAERLLAHQALVAGFQYLARQDPKTAAKLWMQIAPGRQWRREDSMAISRQIGLSLAYRHELEAIEWLDRVPVNSDERVQEWRVLSALRHGRWALALQGLSQMSAEAQQDSRWRYWIARCQEALGNVPAASDIYESLAKERSYYGFLGADRVGLPYRFQHQPLPFSDTDLHPIATLPAIVRAHELYLLERWPDARREWYFATRKLPDLDAAKAARIAQVKWWWHAQSP